LKKLVKYDESYECPKCGNSGSLVSTAFDVEIRHEVAKKGAAQTELEYLLVQCMCCGFPTFMECKDAKGEVPKVKGLSPDDRASS